MNMKFLNYSTAILFTLGAYACSSGNGDEKWSISGSIVDGAGKQLILEHLTTQKVYNVDTTVINEDGSFNFTHKVPETGFYRIKQDERSFITLIIQPNETVMVKSKVNIGYQPYTVEGSPESSKLQLINTQMTKFYNMRDSLSMVFKANEGNQEILVQLQGEYAIEAENNAEFMRNFIRENPSSFACLAAAEQLNPEDDYELFLLIDSELEKNYASSAYHAEFHKVVESMKTLSIGAVAPDIILPNAEGEMVSLSSLKGKVVLVDFWASWCKPCRMENPNVVRAYNEYKDRGFEVFGVSLDKERESWLQAIQDDGLHWTQVSDLKFWGSAVVKLYDIKGIPFALLLDKEGVIIAKNLRGAALQNKLEEVLD
ncbi:MAG TPA: alkyl hydroperoxide reductase [Flavobacteriales bacterium]|nr:alkyl hydroperoxide reductase [Flavobacteriales bacterium]